MIYAYDENIQMPVKDLYDSQIMLAAVNAAKDMYEKGQKQMDDFVKNYGDFYSPISKDMDWYQQNVTGKAAKALDWMYENGVDPARSAEGRAMLARIANSMPIGEINKRKQAAAAAQEYIKNRGELEAKGLFNSDFERYTLGGKSLEDWDTKEDGMWTRTSPSEFKDLNQYTSHIFDALEPEYIETKDGFDWSGITYDRMMKSLTPDRVGGLLNTSLGRFHYEMAKRDLQASGVQDPTEKQILDKFKDNIVWANNEKMEKTRTINPLYELQLKDQYDAKKFRREHSGDYSLINQNSAPLSYTQQVQINSEQRYLDSILRKSDNEKEVANRAAQYWYNQLQAILPKGDTKTWQQRYNNLPNDQKQKYKSFVNRYNQWKNISKAGSEKQANELMKKYGFVSKDGAPTEKLIYDMNSSNTSGGSKLGVKNYKDLDELYGQYESPVEAQAQNYTYEVMGTGHREKYPGGSGQYYSVNLGAGNVSFARIRKAKVVGGTSRYRYNDMNNIFQRWLKQAKPRGYFVESGNIPQSAYINTPNGAQMDLSAYASIPIETFDEFVANVEKNKNGIYKDLKKKADKNDVDVKTYIANELGLLYFDNKGANITNKSKNFNNATYVWIPTITTIENKNGQVFSQINEGYDKLRFGGAKAYELSSLRNQESAKTR